MRLDRFDQYSKMVPIELKTLRQYLNTDGYGKTYYTYEITDIACDLMIKLVELLEIAMNDKKE